MTRRETILEAALESLEAGGGVTIESVRERSGASVGSIYHHFGDKDGIFGALYAQVLSGYQAGVLRILKSAPNAEDGIKALVRHHLRWVEQNPEQARFLLDGSARERAGEEVSALNKTLFAAIAAWVESQEAIRSVRLDVFFVSVFGPAQALSRSWLAHQDGSLREAEDDLADAAWRAVRSD
ncbi:MAG TPA: TetR/AcrR family transcriptional regulator [Solirubrobacterales bacterium]|nr:TetR/AcrR family transcriptional regulator [Solirubrobacterales bacterium]